MNIQKQVKRIVLALWPILAFCFGVAGFWQRGGVSWWGALYGTIQLFALNIDAMDAQENLLLRIAATMAVITTTAVILTFFQKVWQYAGLLLWRRRGDAVAIHTDCEEDLEALLTSLGPAGRVSDHRLAFQAPKHLFYYKDGENLTKLMKNRAGLLQLDSNRRYYLCCSELTQIASQSPFLTFVSPQQNCARLYWKDYPLAAGGESVVLIGFGSYAQALLEQALYMNVLSLRKNANYHVFAMNEEEAGRITTFLALHTELERMVSVNQASADRDALLFYQEDPYLHPELLQKSRLIVAGDSDSANLNIAGTLSRYFLPRYPLYLRVSSREACTLLYGSGTQQSTQQMIPFGMTDEILSCEVVFGQTLERQARMMDASYLLHNMPESLPEACRKMTAAQLIETKGFLEHWNAYPAFTRLSNLTLADHIPYKLQLLLGPAWKELPQEALAQKADEAWNACSAQQQDQLGEIEHIRWRRCHYMNNWRYAPARDNARRLHPYLVPYAELEEPIKQMDRDNYAELTKYL